MFKTFISSGGVITANFFGLAASDSEGCRLVKGWKTLGLDVCRCDRSNRADSVSTKLGSCFLKCMLILSWTKIRSEITSSAPFVKNSGDGGEYRYLTSHNSKFALLSNFFGTPGVPLVLITTCKRSLRLRAAIFIWASKIFGCKLPFKFWEMPRSSNSMVLKFG